MEQEPVESFSTIEKEPTKSKSKLWIIILCAVIILGLIVTGIFFLAKADPSTTSQVRDIFIIFLPWNRWSSELFL